MAQDNINSAGEPSDEIEEKITKQHVEISSDSRTAQAISEEWQEPKPKLNLQIVLAFLVGCLLKITKLP
jgi:capsular polysaccharide biosynthesis protein